jgi:hypothetical protein
MMTTALASLPVVSYANAGAATSLSTVPTCIQGQLQVGIEDGVLNQPLAAPNGYTFLIVKVTGQTCAIQGFPWWIVFSTPDGFTVNSTALHRPNSLFAQPPARRVILNAHSVASFGLSYRYFRAPASSPASKCVASLVDFRLPATAAHKFSFEFPMHIDLCAANRQFDVTPVEARTSPVA